MPLRFRAVKQSSRVLPRQEAIRQIETQIDTGHELLTRAQTPLGGFGKYEKLRLDFLTWQQQNHSLMDRRVASNPIEHDQEPIPAFNIPPNSPVVLQRTFQQALPTWLVILEDLLAELSEVPKKRPPSKHEDTQNPTINEFPLPRLTCTKDIALRTLKDQLERGHREDNRGIALVWLDPDPGRKWLISSADLLSKLFEDPSVRRLFEAAVYGLTLPRPKSLGASEVKSAVANALEALIEISLRIDSDKGAQVISTTSTIETTLSTKSLLQEPTSKASHSPIVRSTMPFNATVYRVIISSPSDLRTERNSVDKVIQDWNHENYDTFHVLLQPRRWERDSTPALGDRPQAILNRQIVDDSDIMVALFWTRLGSPTGEAESGTVEEINRFLDSGKHVLLYFSSAPIPQNANRDQFERLRGFKETIKKKGIVGDFSTKAKLGELVRTHLTRVVRELQPKPNASRDHTRNGNAVPQQGRTRFASQFQSFLLKFEANWEAERDSGSVNIDRGKRILADAGDQIGNFIGAANDSEIQAVLGAALKKARKLCQTRLFADGGAGWARFWLGGDEVVALLRQLLTTLD